ncbi:Holliday junction endonuclease RuvC [Breoghania corrubedonensis]|uniref:Crossover junction endodeoxyribonuclease RuvC n=1 Tax=Breoghania corrubedonensis TaxID=665038 RepID=A0A2T5V7E6_9HYPH|nr:crossover junction endodeoxyribonuclease RuvC [Breoghania corrubedonensis]PTW59673.1 Holliday junction endonuclease RuvC [Breoghania corrubedonensis]
MNPTIRILGIDPGLRNTGWGVIDVTGTNLKFVASGTVHSTQALALAERLVELHDGLTRVIEDYVPDEAAVEQTFVNKDAGATLKLGQARGIALLVPGLKRLPIGEYLPNLIKKTVVGAGHGDKKQIRMMVKVLMPKATFNSDDAADALAIAVCHAHHRGAAAAAARVAARIGQ